MIPDPLEVKQFPPESDHVRVGRGFVDSADSYRCAWEIANRLVDAGLVETSDWVEVNNPFNLHRELFSVPPVKAVADLLRGLDYVVYPNGWPTDVWSFVAHELMQHGVEANTAEIPGLQNPVPATPNALTRVAHQWTSLHTRLRDTLGLDDVDHSGNAYLKAIDQLQVKLEGTLERNRALTEERNRLEQRLQEEGLNAIVAARDAEIAALKAQLKSAGEAAQAQLLALYESFVSRRQVEYLTLRMDVTFIAEQAKLDADVAAKVNEGWQVEYRAINTTPATDDYPIRHFEFVKLARPIVARPDGEPLKAAAEAPAPVEPKAESVEVGEFQRIIVSAVPVETAVLNGLVHLGDGHYRLPGEVL